MTGINVLVDTKRLEDKLTALERQHVPSATRLALTRTVVKTRRTVQQYMQLTLDRPTPYTLRGVLFKTAERNDPVAEVFLRDEATKGTAPAQYLANLVKGRQRGQKRFERALAATGRLGRNEAAEPAKAMRLNRYGNVPASRIVQILSQTKSFSEVGALANVTKRSRARGGRSKYFIPNEATRNRLHRGVYERYGKRGIRPVLLFIPLPRYAKQFKFYETVQQDVRRRYEGEFREALHHVLRKHGLR